jgi:apolipoprotein N-acyltransferase
LTAALHRRLPFPVVAAAAAGAGALQALAFVHTTWLWWLPLLATAGLVVLLDRSSPRQAAGLGWLYGSGWLVAGVWWLFISMHTYGGLPAPLAAVAVWALAAALSLYLAAACWAYARWRRGTGADALLFAALWLLAELARGVIFTGFPWVASGYAQLDGPLAGLAPWGGVYGMGAAAAGVAAALAGVLRPPQPGQAALPARRVWLAPMAALAGLGASAALMPNADRWTRPAGTLEVSLLQTNVDQGDKFDLALVGSHLSWLGREMVAASADLVVVPETAVPLLPSELESLAPGFWPALVAHFAAPGRAALVGIPLGDFERGYTNSVAGLSPAAANGEFYGYDKWHLVPFGEFIPTGFRWFTEMMHIPLGDFARGMLNPPSFAVGAQRVAPNICYEDLFGEELARRFIEPAKAPTLLANVSNMGWFGRSSAIEQHLNISRLRTLELQRPMVRATNTGATAVISHRGEVQALLPPHTRGVLQGTVQAREGITPFAWWAARAGLWPLWMLGAGVVLAAAWRARAGVRRAP